MRSFSTSLALALLSLLTNPGAQASETGLERRRTHHSSGSSSHLSKRGYALRSRWETTDELKNAFNFVTDFDKSGGYVQYVDRATAEKNGMVATGSKGGLKFSADTKTVGQGARKSIRLESVINYGRGMYIFDIAAMPVGCGTWPALFTSTGSGDWPYGGEFDIIENVNGVTNMPNIVALHTGPNCTMPKSTTSMSGTQGLLDCNVENNANYNSGCLVHMNDHPKSYGKLFNQNSGGVYAMQRAEAGINVWFWSHANAPAGTKRGDRQTINIGSWGKPSAAFPWTNSCTADHINYNQTMVFTIDFCGSYVQSRWASDGCAASVGPMSCNDYIANNLTDAKTWFWDLNSISIWNHI